MTAKKVVSKEKVAKKRATKKKVSKRAVPKKVGAAELAVSLGILETEVAVKSAEIKRLRAKIAQEFPAFRPGMDLDMSKWSHPDPEVPRWRIVPTETADVSIDIDLEYQEGYEVWAAEITIIMDSPCDSLCFLADGGYATASDAIKDALAFVQDVQSVSTAGIEKISSLLEAQ